MLRALVLLWCFALCIKSSNILTWSDRLLSPQLASPRIAVCVSGQVTRWQPQHLSDGLLAANPAYRFYLFYNLQESKNLSAAANIYSTDPHLSFEVSPMARLSMAEAAAHIDRLLHGNAQLASMAYVGSKSAAEWQAHFNVSALDRIRDHTGSIQSSILNMYAHQPRCMEQIELFERSAGWRFAYVLNTREDVYFFRPLQLSSLLPMLVAGQCDLPYKGCLNFWGHNMRFYAMRRQVAGRYLSSRLAFYQRLYAMNRTVKNPEKFELLQARSQGFQGCKLTVEQLPVTAVRHVAEGQFCFILLEYYQCLPQGQEFEELIKQRACTAVARRMKLKAQRVAGQGKG